MKRTLGIILIFIGIFGAGYGISGFRAATSTFAAKAETEAALICAKDERVLKRSRMLYSSSSRGTVYFCENSTGQQREITNQLGHRYIAAVIPSIVMLFIGIVISFVGSWLILRKITAPRS